MCFLTDQEAHTVTKTLVENVFLKYSLCHVLLSYQGLKFENKILQTILSIFGVTKFRTSSYRPQSNANCKVLHSVLNTMFAKCVSESQTRKCVAKPSV